MREQIAFWSQLELLLLQHEAAARKLLRAWATRSFYGSLKRASLASVNWRKRTVDLPDGGRLTEYRAVWAQPNRLEDESLIKAIHVEAFWRSTEARKTFRELCMREFAEIEVPYVATSLEDSGIQEQLVAEFCDWLEQNPMPPVYRVPIDDGTGKMTGDVQALARRVGAAEAASILGVNEREAQRLMAESKILAVKSPTGDWLTTVADVFAYWERRPGRGGSRPGAGSGGARPGAGRPKSKHLEHDEHFVSVEREQGYQTQRMRNSRNF